MLERQYKSTELSTVRAELDPTQARELLYKVYEQTATTWRALVDVRFKLLAAVPTASLVSLATVFGGGETPKMMAPGVRVLFAVLGLVVTAGLLVYDLRNSQLHDDLISRGRKIEEELGVETGVFRGRLIARWPLQHDVATGLLYGAALVAWAAAVWIAANQAWCSR